ncbi:MAG: hypothetical protein EB053_05530, partial [Chlamydiae bacterium]|nr:hypothetical protein [Chlamydiota bacterium]
IFKEEIGRHFIHFVCHKRLQSHELIPHFEQILLSHDLVLEQRGSVFHISKKPDEPPIKEPLLPQNTFHIVKLQYHPGSEVIDAIKQASIGLTAEQDSLRKALESTQWVRSTNSIVFTAPSGVDRDVEAFIKRLDVPLKQVFIEVLVIDTNMRKGLDFGLDWSMEAKKGQLLPKIDQSFLSKNPFGFNLGIIGDLIRHKGESYLSLSSLVSALQIDADVRIVLNQKVIAQDNKPSKIFVGDNLPFAGSTIQTNGQTQQTTANIDYRDVGVSLLITPLIGEGGMITLNIVEEISEAMKHQTDFHLSGIQTTKTNMSTSAHVPNAHFLVLSGMARNSKTQKSSGVPCLGGLPYIGSLFNKTEEMDEKRSILIFVRPELVETNHYIAFSKDNTSFCTPEVFTPVDQKESELKMGDLSWLRK